MSTGNVLPHREQTVPFRACCPWRGCCVSRHQKGPIGGPVRVTVTVTATAAVICGTAVNPVQRPAAQREKMGVSGRNIHIERAHFLLHSTPPKDMPPTPRPSATRPLKVAHLTLKEIIIVIFLLFLRKSPTFVCQIRSCGATNMQGKKKQYIYRERERTHADPHDLMFFHK